MKSLQLCFTEGGTDRWRFENAAWGDLQKPIYHSGAESVQITIKYCTMPRTPWEIRLVQAEFTNMFRVEAERIGTALQDWRENGGVLQVVDGTVV